MSRPNHLSTFRSDLREARRLGGGDQGRRWSAQEKALNHRYFRRISRQALRDHREPPIQLWTGWYL